MIEDGMGEAFEEMFEAIVELNVGGIPLNISYAEYLLRSEALIKATTASSKEKWLDDLVVIDTSGKITETVGEGNRIKGIDFAEVSYLEFGLTTPDSEGGISLSFSRDHPSRLRYYAVIRNGEVANLMKPIPNPGRFYKIISANDWSAFYSFARIPPNTGHESN